MTKNELLERLKEINIEITCLISEVLKEDYELETSITDPDYLPPAWRKHQEEQDKRKKK